MPSTGTLRASLLALLACLGLAISAMAADTPPLPPNAPGEVSAVWYVSPAGEPLGPFAIPALVEMAQAAKLARETPAWKEGMAAWAMLADIPELAPVLAAIPAGKAGPPPPPNAQTLLDDKLKAFLAGTWRFEGDVSGTGYPMHVVLEITYRADGSYAGTQSSSLQGPSGVAVDPTTESRSGTFTVTGIDENNFTLNLVERGRGTLTVNLKIVDPNTIEDTGTLNRHYRVR